MGKHRCIVCTHPLAVDCSSASWLGWACILILRQEMVPNSAGPPSSFYLKMLLSCSLACFSFNFQGSLYLSCRTCLVLMKSRVLALLVQCQAVHSFSSSDAWDCRSVCFFRMLSFSWPFLALIVACYVCAFEYAGTDSDHWRLALFGKTIQQSACAAIMAAVCTVLECVQSPELLWPPWCSWCELKFFCSSWRPEICGVATCTGMVLGTVSAVGSINWISSGIGPSWFWDSRQSYSYSPLLSNDISFPALQPKGRVTQETENCPS